ncbi:AI-2E family transporter [Roseobacter sp. OBYS 0001]|uniref:AI-2E family transporter n=1 Tax=Roseobacter sp. OBYS 0001 TaxID=882651 RepID=UPI001BB96390|nr:AI-2E family transporter [Roseobacter sp. OBYS 0001]GIT87434.1 AI-2E family transporter [Roseobacter sp. OBYS 0001]
MQDLSTTPDNRRVDLTRLALVAVGASATVWLLESGTPVFLPLVFALVVGVVFAPLSNFFDRLGAPPVVGALAVLITVLSVITLGVVLFYPVVAEFMTRVPFMWTELQQSLSGLKSTMENVENVQNQVAITLAPEGSAEMEAPGAVAVPTVAGILSYLPSFAAQIMVFVGILYFFLLTKLELYKYIASVTTHLSEKVLRRAEVEVSRYFLAITAINACFGALVSLMLSAYGMPNAAYWGLGAFLVNYVLYLGPISFAIVLLLGGLIVFDGAMSVLPALTYMLMNMTEGQFVTPTFVGKQMSVNPLLIFTSLVFWLWIWGPVGGIIAIPLLVWLRQINKEMHGRDPIQGDRDESRDLLAKTGRNSKPEMQYDVAE